MKAFKRLGLLGVSVALCAIATPQVAGAASASCALDPTKGGGGMAATSRFGTWRSYYNGGKGGGHGGHNGIRDVAKAPLSDAEWQGMIAGFGEKLVNRASLTWRGMSDGERAGTPLEMLTAKPSLMKRPAIVVGDQRLLGWTANVKRALGVAA